MADQGEDDPELATLTAHADGDPPQAIVVTPGQTACDVKPHVIAILPTYCGKSYEGPYEFLNEFCKISDSINTWADFKSVFLAEFFPSSKTSALKRKISCIRQEYDETLSEYWEKYMSLLESCPNHRMKEIEVHHTFYEGMNKETKDLANSSSGGDFTQLRVSEAKKVLRKLLNAKKTYDNARDGYNRERVASASATDQEERMDLKMEELKKELLTAIKQNTPPPSPNGGKEAPELPYEQPDNSLDMEQANAAGYYNSNGNWIPGRQRDAPWRDHQNFRWGDGNQNQNQNQTPNQPNPHPNQNSNRGSTNPDYQSNWVGRNHHPHNQNPQNQNPNPAYVPPHQRNNQNQNQNQFNPGPQHNSHNQNENQYQHNHDQYNPPAQYNQYPQNQNQQNFSGYQSNPPPQYNQHQGSN
ncbi:GATA zinc finger domain-containing protein 14-like [Salvia hispanica]|uniref:GATA zinc finger domain-containing protein 14-like n=1 Tax=Salvia hispanica TaxID=49212 RepID=UPI0020092893|nr:GATA zinc finger domain-containing protein 14-like [Salvia hispanica]